MTRRSLTPAPVKRKAITPAQRKRALEAYGNKCALCQTEDGPFDIDHWVPVIFGGENEDDNLRPLCVPCHQGVTRITVGQNAKVKRLLGLTKKRDWNWAKRSFPKGRKLGIPGMRKKLTGRVERL